MAANLNGMIMKSMVPNTLVFLFGFFLLFVNVSELPAQEASANKPTKAVTETRIGYLRAYEPQLALSVLDIPPRDEGVAGANVAIDDNNTTGKFMGQSFTLDVTEMKFDADVVPDLQGDGCQGRPLHPDRHLRQAAAVDR